MVQQKTYRICITGTESTGKSVLAGQLATHFNTIFVPDASRTYIEQLSRPYTEADVLEIAKQIIAQEDELLPQTNRILFSDNDLLNIKIWLQYYNWEVPEWLHRSIENRKADLYLLCDIDLPWVADSQRANPLDRAELLARFKAELEALGAHYELIAGNNDIRLQNAVNQVNKILI